jgi:hypothetical protein
MHRHTVPPSEPLIFCQVAWRDEGDDHPHGLTLFGIPKAALKVGKGVLRTHFADCVVKPLPTEEFILFKPVFEAWEAQRRRDEEEQRQAAERKARSEAEHRAKAEAAFEDPSSGEGRGEGHHDWRLDRVYEGCAYMTCARCGIGVGIQGEDDAGLVSADGQLVFDSERLYGVRVPQMSGESVTYYGPAAVPEKMHRSRIYEPEFYRELIDDDCDGDFLAALAAERTEQDALVGGGAR